jgi:uncharacterized protein YndB with AHSA1/START domain
MAADVSTSVTDDTASATAVVDASPEEVFDFVRRPANHAEISGDRSVRGMTKGPEKLGAGDKFGQRMKVGLPYRMNSKVVEFEENRRIAWCHLGGHRWRWEVEPEGDGRTKVTETFDMTTSRAPFLLRRMGYPKGHEDNVRNSVANVAGHFNS